MQHPPTATSWATLPTEMKFSIVELLHDRGQTKVERLEPGPASRREVRPAGACADGAFFHCFERVVARWHWRKCGWTVIFAWVPGRADEDDGSLLLNGVLGSFECPGCGLFD